MKTNKELWRKSISSEATCGLIGLVDDWVLVGGNELYLWRGAELKTVDDKDLIWIHDIRQTGDFEVEILTDPWADYSAIWKFDILSEKKYKVRNFPDYGEKEYTDDVIW